MKQILLVSLIALGLAACGGSGSDSDITAPHVYEGIWLAPAYGEVRQIEGNRVRTYQYTSDYCVLADEDAGFSLAELEAAIELSNDGQSFTIPVEFGTKDFHAPAYVYSKTDALPDSCLQPVAIVGESGYQQDSARDFDMFWQAFDELSVAFEKVDVDWNSLYATYASQAARTTAEFELLEIYYQITQPLQDGHVHINSPSGARASTNGKPIQWEVLLAEYIEANDLSLPLTVEQGEGFNQYMNGQTALYEAIIRDYADSNADIKTAVHDLLMWFKVDNIAYLNIAAMTGYGDEEDAAESLAVLNNGLDAAMEDIRDASGLIIDVRTNNGGNDFISLAIASRFLDTTRHVYSKQARLGNSRTPLEEVMLAPAASGTYTGPIVLLTSNSTFSAAETFAISMRSLPHVTLMGQSTQGAFSDMLDRSLPNGFTFTLSNEYYLSNQGEWFEGSGVPVDVEVPTFTQEERLNEEDLALEQAFAFLIGG
ncbi:MAG: S41 family peptidase [Thiotrichales bacterium]